MSSINRREFMGLSLSALSALTLAACGGSSQSSSASSSSSSTPSDTSSAEAGHITASGTLTTPYDEGYSSGLHHATIVVKDYGTIKVELDADTAPVTVSNFAHLANQGFYDGLKFHRIMKDFMVQGGDPKGDGTGGSDVNIIGEFSANGKKNDIKHERGVISMARSSSNNSASSQFFIMHKTTASLDGQYAAFGHVTEGMDVVDKLAEVPATDDNGTVAEENKPIIESIKMDD
jgi:peptidyl-prolyl cis-trans isomerase B (cyclophilin B)